MSAPVSGILIAVLIDVALPMGLAALLIVHNRRNRRTAAGERGFWIGTGVYLALVGVVVWRGIVDVFGFGGGGVVGATIMALPSSLVAAVANSNLIHFFFAEKEWAHFGYFVVLTVYVSGMVAWALVNALALRALIERGRRVYQRQEQAARLRESREHSTDGFRQLGI